MRLDQDPSDLMPLHVLVPVRSVSGGKLRLGGALDAEEREELVLGMLRHTLSVLVDWGVATCIHVVSPDGSLGLLVARPGVTIHLQSESGLNEAVALGQDLANASAAASLLVLPGDLPLLEVDALETLLTAADAALVAARGGPLVVVAPSDARSGTNALLLRPVSVIEPRFGAASLEAHLREAARVDAAVQVVNDPVLGFDLDTPDDVERLDQGRLIELMALGREPAMVGADDLSGSDEPPGAEDLSGPHEPSGADGLSGADGVPRADGLSGAHERARTLD